MPQIPSPQITHICCIGAGYVGGPTSAIISQNCPSIKVTVVDTDAKRISAWNSPAALPIYEPGLEAIIRNQLNINLFFSTDIDKAIAESQLIFIAVNTPPLEIIDTDCSGRRRGAGADLSAVMECAQRIARVSTSSKIIVEKSTVPCGTSHEVGDILQKYARSGVQFQVLSNPEFLSEGTAVRDLQHPDRVIIGSALQTASEAQEHLKYIYKHWVPADRIITMSQWSAELTKLASNALLAQRVSSINSLSALCESLGADIKEVARGCGADSRIGGDFLRASLGFGGSCFHKDLSSLVWLCDSLRLTPVADYWHQVLLMNEFQTSRFAQRILSTINVRGARIACLGFAFKEGTGDARNTPATRVCRELLTAGARLSVYDPKVPADHILSMLTEEAVESTAANSARVDVGYNCVSVCSRALEAIEGAQAVVVLTAWPEFRCINWEQALQTMPALAHIFDGQAMLDHEYLQKLGFQVVSMGK
ncbi:UDP-glucose 6-dehydrogenase [Kickxella alabastrina]|uniref:UDP-glucose 6-dehydrogenase n=1 Tax=Kickxella alabastrina TaxID=61397 RepID=UPI0022210024|nr:UDP-glucose 6-dehydrogenase [Kickxella alabastrina]KAI7832090.1 UDP-glucose 6-dehydrogenase [Kickxella alabastrina]